MIYLIHCNSCVYYMLSAWQAFGQIPYVDKDGQSYLNKWVYNNQGRDVQKILDNNKIYRKRLPEMLLLYNGYRHIGWK